MSGRFWLSFHTIKCTNFKGRNERKTKKRFSTWNGFVMVVDWCFFIRTHRRMIRGKDPTALGHRRRQHFWNALLQRVVRMRHYNVRMVRYPTVDEILEMREWIASDDRLLLPAIVATNEQLTCMKMWMGRRDGGSKFVVTNPCETLRNIAKRFKT